MFYVYRCTSDKLEHHLNRVVEAGDQVVWPVFTGGRDWLLVCRRGGSETTRATAAEITRIQAMGGGQ